MSVPASVAVLGATGSIGRQTLDVARHLGIRVTALSANSDVKSLEALCREFKPKTVCIGDSNYVNLKTALADVAVKILCGEEGLAELAESDPSPTLVNAVLGMKGLVPTLRAARAGKSIAFANKETLVAGATLVTRAVREGNAKLIPVDSEHSAIYQCLLGSDRKDLKQILLTGSGGPFLGKDKAFLAGVTPEMAVRHPKWNMGKKISVDSASLMNKGLELIEAMHLFDVPESMIRVVIHPQSVVHSLVAFKDNTVIAQLAQPDMRLCIQYALTTPRRYASPAAELDLVGKRLEFLEPDVKTFPLLALARESAARGGNVPAAMNGANEYAVGAFLEGRIGFTRMFDLVIEATHNAAFIAEPTLDDILSSDASAREYVKTHI